MLFYSPNFTVHYYVTLHYHVLVYTRPLSITNPAFWLATQVTQPLSIRDDERSRVRIRIN